jgi:hypothetical protein
MCINKNRYDAAPASLSFVLSSIFSIRKFLLRHLALPRPYFLRFHRLTKTPSVDGRYFFTQWEGAPFYVKPTLLNRWGPGAWVTRAMGLPLPGDRGDTYYPNGYFLPDVGPKNFEGKGREQLQKMKERLERERTGKCPFHIAAD